MWCILKSEGAGFSGCFMNRVELVDSIASVSGVKRNDVDRVVSAFTEVVTAELAKGEEVRLLGFGSFCVVHRNATEGRNMQTGEKVKIPERNSPKFKPGKNLKDAVTKSSK